MQVRLTVRGLGLSIVKAFAERHDATLTIEPRSKSGLSVELVAPA